MYNNIGNYTTMVSIGVKLRGVEKIVDPEKTYVRPGVVYELVYRVEKIGGKVEMGDVVNLFARLKERWPNICINYLEITGDRVVVQFYDDEALGVPLWAIVVGIIALLSLLLITVILEEAKEIIPYIVEKVEKSPVVGYLAIVAGTALLILSGAYLIKTLRGR